MDSNLFSLVVPKLAYSSRFHYAKNQLKINRHILVEMKKKLKKIYMSSITNSLILQKCAAVLLMSVCFITHEKEAKNASQYCSGLFFLGIVSKESSLILPDFLTKDFCWFLLHTIYFLPNLHTICDIKKTNLCNRFHTKLFFDCLRLLAQNFAFVDEFL